MTASEAEAAVEGAVRRCRSLVESWMRSGGGKDNDNYYTRTTTVPTSKCVGSKSRNTIPRPARLGIGARPTGTNADVASGGGGGGDRPLSFYHDRTSNDLSVFEAEKLRKIMTSGGRSQAHKTARYMANAGLESGDDDEDSRARLVKPGRIVPRLEGLAAHIRVIDGLLG